jgi:hypothetical protein
MNECYKRDRRAVMPRVKNPARLQQIAVIRRYDEDLLRRWKEHRKSNPHAVSKLAASSGIPVQQLRNEVAGSGNFSKDNPCTTLLSSVRDALFNDLLEAGGTDELHS